MAGFMVAGGLFPQALRSLRPSILEIEPMGESPPPDPDMRGLSKPRLDVASSSGLAVTDSLTVSTNPGSKGSPDMSGGYGRFAVSGDERPDLLDSLDGLGVTELIKSLKGSSPDGGSPDQGLSGIWPPKTFDPGLRGLISVMASLRRPGEPADLRPGNPGNPADLTFLWLLCWPPLLDQDEDEAGGG